MFAFIDEPEFMDTRFVKKRCAPADHCQMANAVVAKSIVRRQADHVRVVVQETLPVRTV